MKIMTVCGLGQGTSLLLKMNVEEVMNSLGMDAEVDNTDLSSVALENPDLILAGEYHLDSLKDAAVPVIGISDFMDVEEIKNKLINYFESK